MIKTNIKLLKSAVFILQKCRNIQKSMLKYIYIVQMCAVGDGARGYNGKNRFGA